LRGERSRAGRMHLNGKPADNREARASLPGYAAVLRALTL
jgi:hypothetical protein